MHVYTVPMNSQTLHIHPNKELLKRTFMCTRCRCTHKLNKRPKDVKDVYVKCVNASAPCTHTWTPEKNCLILIILQCNTEHKNIFLHIPGLKITQIEIPRHVVDNVGTLTTWRHMKTSSLKRKDQTSLAWCTLQFWSNLTKRCLQGRHFNYFCVLL